MSITTIADPTIRLVASKKLCAFVGKELKATQAMPKNIADIFSSQTGRACSKIIEGSSVDDIQNVKYTDEEEQFLKTLALDEENEAEFKELIAGEDSDDENDEEEDEEAKEKTPEKKDKGKGTNNKKQFHITLSDVKWLDQVLREKRSEGKCQVYVHELLESCDLVLPQNEVLERNPELEARCVKLRQKQEEYMYQKMTRNVDTSYKDKEPEDTISFQMKMMNRQLIAVAQFLFSVAAGFAFGFTGIELIIGGLDFGFRLLLGIMIALVIALAEIYFLAKRLSTEDSGEAQAFLATKKRGGGSGIGESATIKPHQE